MDYLIEKTYHNTELQQGSLAQLRQDLLVFPEGKGKQIRHFAFTENQNWIETDQKIKPFLKECRDHAKKILLTKWNVSFEYFLETKRYYVLFQWITGG